ncbi:MAG: hypothetical protein ISP91_04760 [Pseudomonadales bacterium]|nr:hypothetical protein [Pseudomonadales bacterium]
MIVYLSALPSGHLLMLAATVYVDGESRDICSLTSRRLLPPLGTGTSRTSGILPPGARELRSQRPGDSPVTILASIVRRARPGNGSRQTGGHG